MTSAGRGYDAVVIGAGVGGMAAAARLARDGRRVVVVEQDSQVGGTSRVFRRAGFSFPTGPLSFSMPTAVAGMLRELGVTRFLTMRRDTFQVRRSGLDVVISAPLERVAQQLRSQFPHEASGIDAAVAELGALCAALAALGPEDLIEGAAPGSRGTDSVRGSGGHLSPDRARALDLLRTYEHRTARDVVDRHVRAPAVRDLLGGQGTNPATLPAVLWAQMWRFMAVEGIWYPTEGIDTVPRLLARQLAAAGGEVRLGSVVERILVDEGQVRGVEVRPADGSGGAATGAVAGLQVLSAPLVVCDVDYRLALGMLPGTVALEEREAAARRPLTRSDFTLFLGVERDRVDLSAFRGDQLLVRLDDGEPAPRLAWRRSAAEFARDELWFAWWSRRDPLLAPPGCEALVLKVGTPYEVFAPFDGGARGRHAASYYAAKEELADELLRAGEAVVPGLRAAVRVREVATPLTFRHWGHRSEGSVAGWSWRARDIAGLLAQDLIATSVAGLRMVGLQAYTRLFWGGVGSSLHSGLRAADADRRCTGV